MNVNIYQAKKLGNGRIIQIMWLRTDIIIRLETHPPYEWTDIYLVNDFIQLSSIQLSRNHCTVNEVIINEKKRN